MIEPERAIVGDQARLVPNVNRSATMLAVLAVALAVMLVVAWGTRPLGPGLYGDGAAYMSAAQSMARTGKLRVIGAPYWSSDSTTFMGQWPPGFSMALAVPIRIGLPLFTSVSIVEMLASAATVALTVVLVANILGLAWGVGAAVAVIVTPALLGTELNVASEPLYVAGLALMLLAMTWRRDRALPAGLVAAGLVLVRYLGVAAVAGAGLWSAMRPGRPVERAGRAAVAVAPGAVAYWVWMLVVRANGGAARSVIPDRDVVGTARRFVGATAAWLAPWDDGPSWLHVIAKLAIVVLALGAAALAVRSRASTNSASRSGPGGEIAQDQTALRLLTASVVLAACHLAMIFSSQLLISSVEFTSRMFAPVHYLFTVMAVTAAGSVWETRSRGRALAAAALAIWFAGSTWQSVGLLHESRTVGLDHARPEERHSPTIAWLRDHGRALPIYTNEPAKIFFHVQRDSRLLPWIVTPDTLRRLDEVLRDRPGYVVWFAGGTAQGYVPQSLLPYALSPERLTTALPLTAVAKFPDGVIWVRDSVERADREP